METNNTKKYLMNSGNVLFLQIIGGFFLFKSFVGLFGLDTAGPSGPFIVSLIAEGSLIIWGFILYILNTKRGVKVVGTKNYIFSYISLTIFILIMIPLFLLLIHY